MNSFNRETILWIALAVILGSFMAMMLIIGGELQDHQLANDNPTFQEDMEILSDVP